ncbi:JmjC domain-containing protein [Serratia plymuthica]|uniref:JmjC domain-containing protein n=1 Tax=Serratia plymuthica TaxID=82996 RepID=UPI00390CAD0C
MTNDKFSIQGIEPFSIKEFQDRPYFFECVDGFDLLSWEDLNELLEKDIIDYPRVRLANDNNSLSRGYKGFITHTLSVTGDKSPHVNRYNLLKNLQNGSTLIIDRCQAFFKPVAIATEYFKEKLQCRSTANLYCAWSETPSFGNHFDNHDVIAIQIEGIKKWDIYRPTYPYPMLSDKSFNFSPPQESPYMTVDLSPGQAIYLPAGYWHNVSTQSERSLHISFPIIRPRKIDVIRTFLDSLVRYEDMRKPIAFGGNESKNNELKDILSECIKGIDIDSWESALIEECKNQNYVKFNLPNIRTKYD